MEKPLISVIIPVYNVESFVCHCIDTVLAQTYSNIEVILVDDGSQDASPIICDEYEKKDRRVRAIHRNNGGQSAARNSGLSIARGEYIGFVDSDDYIDLTMYEKLYNAISYANAQISICGARLVDVDGKETFPELFYCEVLENKTLTNRDIMERLSGRQSICYTVIWNRLYKRDIFNEIIFPEGIIHEDDFTSHHFYHYSKRIACIKEPLYYYVQRPSSTMRSEYSVSHFSAVDAGFDRYKLLNENGYSKKAIKISMRGAYGTLVTAYFRGGKDVIDQANKRFHDVAYTLLKLGEFPRLLLLCLVKNIIIRKFLVFVGFNLRYY